MNFAVDQITNYLVEVTPAKGDNLNPAIYLMRRYEVIVSPRDRYLNVSNSQIRTRFSARFPGEYDNTSPGLADIFANDAFITGPTNYFLASRIAREKGIMELQWIRAFSANDPAVYGQTNPYEILNHAPTAFALTLPADLDSIKLMKAANLEKFEWVKAVPQDPYDQIQISKFDPTVYSDVVSYEIRFIDGISFTRVIPFASDNSGKEAFFTTNHGQLSGIIDQMSGLSTTKSYDVVWLVNATDGLYITQSTPPNGDPQARKGYRLRLIKDQILDVTNPTVPTEYQLSQNFPNPFNPTTSISYALPKAGQVSIVVYDLLGAPVKTLVNQIQSEGNYKVAWDATNDLGMQVPSGNYVIKMVSGAFTQTRKMTLMK
jgi:hypothetical protein